MLRHSFLDTLRMRLIGEKAYDSNRLEREWAEGCGIRMIAPHLESDEPQRKTGVHCVATADAGEWNDGWAGSLLHPLRRRVIRQEYHLENFFGRVRLGGMPIHLRHL